MSTIKAKDIQLVDVESIIENPKNSNRHSIEQIERLKKLIEFNGFRVPLIISNRSGFLVTGHGRLEAAKSLGLEKVPVVFQDFDSEAQEYSFLISDNEIARWAEIDMQSVYDNLETIEIEDMELLGIENFKTPDIIDSYEDKNSEIDTDNFGNDLNATCPKCSFEFQV